jgi:hypothetical protein
LLMWMKASGRSPFCCSIPSSLNFLTATWNSRPLQHRSPSPGYLLWSS